MPGVVPLAVATGAGAEICQSLGTAAFFGMLGVTLITPTLLRRGAAAFRQGVSLKVTFRFETAGR